MRSVRRSEGSGCFCIFVATNTPYSFSGIKYKIICAALCLTDIINVYNNFHNLYKDEPANHLNMESVIALVEGNLISCVNNTMTNERSIFIRHK